LGYGWLLPGAEGVWSDGDNASVVLLLEHEPGSDATLLVDGAGFVTAKCPKQEIDIRVNSVSVGEISYSYSEQNARGTRSVRIPREALVSDNGLAVVKFHFKNNVSPERLGLSPDARNIALFLKGLTLKPVEGSAKR
jgi:hypothetical protein